MPAQLVALSDGPNILVDKPILLFGRHPECDIQLNSRKVSRKHCCLGQSGDSLIVRDLDSTNGIRINGTRVAEGKLKPGDELTIGNFRYRVVWDEMGALPPPSPSAPSRMAAEDAALEEADEPVAIGAGVGASGGRYLPAAPVLGDSGTDPSSQTIKPDSQLSRPPSNAGNASRLEALGLRPPSDILPAGVH